MWLDSFLFLQQDCVITFLYLWHVCVVWPQEWDSKCCLCTVWYNSKMDGSHHTEEPYLQGVSALCRLCGRRSKKAFIVSMTERCYCARHMLLICMLFIKLIFHQTQHPNIQTHYVGLVTCAWWDENAPKFRHVLHCKQQKRTEMNRLTVTFGVNLVHLSLQISALCVPSFWIK